ncbi:AfsR/SARP family transcriptional regulator [Allokutzneria oryzae]|uniref:BTAD domain-containing putative transcriptional regulator n=1 Tax=Allokutzneria oryzae TaxID=1378989 RepID=A0ABV6A5Z9_9PSEU
MALELAVLGDLEARVDGEPVDTGSPRQRTVLAALLVDANRVVPQDQLITRVWGANPPTGVRSTLHTYISRLRAALAASAEVSLTRRPGGYTLATDSANIDLHAFRARVAKARAKSDPAGRAVLLRHALELWRGDALAGFDTEWASSVRITLHKERLAAQIDRVEALLECGRHADLVAELTELTAEHPLDERLCEQLMLALYRNDRRADALQEYQRIRRALADQLGMDPGGKLQELHGRILAAAPDLAAHHRRGSPRGPVPHQLPSAPGGFTGRHAELATLDGSPLTVVSGAGGTGKTSLALHWAHLAPQRFPDGQLYADLRGFDPAEEPAPPPVVLRGFLDALGVQPDTVPDGFQAQVELYRDLVADREMLIVLDNARDVDQIAPLLPGCDECTVVVTSRNHMTALPSTRLVRLDPLDEEDSYTLLALRLGEARLTAEPDAVTELLTLCAGLPLALGIVAARAATSPWLRLSELTDQLRDDRSRLDGLGIGDSRVDLRAVFSWSLRALSPAAAELFGLLGLVPGSEIGRTAVAALTGSPASAGLLSELENANLVIRSTPDRFRMHDLIRLYAKETASDSSEGLRRWVDFHTHSAYNVEQVLFPRRAGIELEAPAPGCVPDTFDSIEAAMAWMDVEHHNVKAAQSVAMNFLWHNRVWQIARAMDTFYWRRGHLLDRVAMWSAGLDAAEALDDMEVRLLCFRSLADAYARAGEHDKGLTIVEHALALAERGEDTAVLGHIHYSLVSAWDQRGDHARGLEHAKAALLAYQGLDNPTWHAQGKIAVGWCLIKLGRHDQARQHCEDALALYRAHGDRSGEAGALEGLGMLAYGCRRYDKALAYFQRARELCEQTGNQYVEAEVVEHIGEAYAGLGRHREARSSWERAAEAFIEQNRTREARRVLALLRGPVPF